MLSGLEVVAVVAGIVSAFNGAAMLYRDWKHKRRKRQEAKANHILEQLVASSGPQIQLEYECDFRRLGKAFARGDDIGRTALMQQLIVLQQTLISLLSGRHPNTRLVKSIVHPNHDSIQRTSTYVRENALKALGEQFQRLAQAAPIPRPPYSPPKIAPRTINRGRNCLERVSARPFPGIAMYPGQPYQLSCISCSWYIPYSASLQAELCDHLTTRDQRNLDDLCFHQKFHQWQRCKDPHCDHDRDCSHGYWCFLCNAAGVMSLGDMYEHIAVQHDWSEICDGMCSNESGRCGNLFADRGRSKQRSHQPLIAVLRRFSSSRQREQNGAHEREPSRGRRPNSKATLVKKRSFSAQGNVRPLAPEIESGPSVPPIPQPGIESRSSGQDFDGRMERSLSGKRSLRSTLSQERRHLTNQPSEPLVSGSQPSSHRGRSPTVREVFEYPGVHSAPRSSSRKLSRVSGGSMTEQNPAYSNLQDVRESSHVSLHPFVVESSTDWNPDSALAAKALRRHSKSRLADGFDRACATQNSSTDRLSRRSSLVDRDSGLGSSSERLDDPFDHYDDGGRHDSTIRTGKMRVERKSSKSSLRKRDSNGEFEGTFKMSRRVSWEPIVTQTSRRASTPPMYESEGSMSPSRMYVPDIHVPEDNGPALFQAKPVRPIKDQGFGFAQYHGSDRSGPSTITRNYGVSRRSSMTLHQDLSPTKLRTPTRRLRKGREAPRDQASYLDIHPGHGDDDARLYLAAIGRNTTLFQREHAHCGALPNGLINQG